MNLAIDLGKTWLRACLCGPDGRVLRRLRQTAMSWRELPGRLPALKRRLGAPKLDRLTVGATGVWRPADRALLTRKLRGAAKDIRVLSDLELAHEAAFRGGAGILVIGGTGSIALGRDDNGRVKRSGGLGALLGDEGSAFWIGRQALKDPRLAERFPRDLALTIAHAPDAVRRTAALSRKVFAWAPRSAAARAIQREAAAHLARLAEDVRAGLRMAGPAPLRWHGSLFNDRPFLKLFLARLPRGKFCTIA